MIEIASMSPEPFFGVRRLRDGALAPLGIGLLMAFVSVWTLRPGPLGIAIVLTSFVVPAAWCSLRSAAGVPRAHAWRSRSFFLSLTAVPLAILGFLALDTAAWLAPRPLASLVLSGLISAGWISEVCFRNAARVPLDPAAESLDRAAGPRPLEGVARLAAPAIACVLLVLDFGAWSESRRADAERAAWAAEILDQVVALGAGRPLDEQIGIVLSSSTHRPEGARFFTIWGDGRVESLDPDASVTLSRPVLESIDARRDRRDAAASVRPRAGKHVAAYRTLGDGRVLVLRLDRAPLHLVGPAPGEGLGFLALILVGVIAHARSLDRHLREAIARIGRAAERLARGDLLDFPAPTGCAGELSRVEHDLVRAARRLDATVERAAGVDETARSAIETLEQAFAELRSSASGRAEELSELRGILERVREQVAAATRKADTLDRALDESAHSVSELGAAGAELNETAAVLTSRVDAVSDSLEQMVRSVKEVGATTDQLAEASEETSSSMEQMASAMRAVDNAAETTANISSEVVEKAELGQAKVVQTIAGMEAIREATDAAERVIRGLGARTKEIGGILDVIDDVADETNLLALNAAIIAAQAGEHGKAFSVVADEIKELADRVLASTKEIGALIRAVQEESENAIGAIEAGSSSVMSGVDLSAEAGRTLEEITIASRESGARIREIVSSVREQTKAASHVVTLMERVRESADQIGAASAQQEQGNEIVYRSALTMREVAQQLQNTTAEQAMGLARIRDNSVGVRSVLEELSRSLASQAECCDEVARRLDGVGERGRTESVEVEAMRRTVEALVERLAQLREDEDGPRRRAGVGESRGASLAGGERR